MLSFYLLHVQLFISELFYHTIHSNFYILFMQFYTFKLSNFMRSNYQTLYKFLNLANYVQTRRLGLFPKQRQS
jgi:hypothetical protein